MQYSGHAYVASNVLNMKNCINFEIICPDNSNFSCFVIFEAEISID